VILESESASLAARMITSDEIDLLQASLENMKTENAQCSKADREFHTLIAHGTHNKVLLKQITHLWDLQDNLNHINQKRESVCIDEDRHSKIADHEAIFEAIKNRNSKAAKKAMQLHFTDLLHAMHEITEKKVVDEARNKALDMRKRFIISNS
jgi:DNA-binding FadR family transcriptional regulator